MRALLACVALVLLGCTTPTPTPTPEPVTQDIVPLAERPAPAPMPAPEIPAATWSPSGQRLHAQALLRLRPEGFALEAARALEVYLQNMPGDTDARFELGWAYELAGRAEPALQAYEKAAGEGARAASLHRAMLLLELERVEDAERVLQELGRSLRKARRGEEALMAARVQFLLGRERKAARVWKRLARKERRRRPLVALEAGVDLAIHASSERAKAKARRSVGRLYARAVRRGGATERAATDAVARLWWRDAAAAFERMRRAKDVTTRDDALGELEEALGSLRETELARWEIDAAVMTAAVYLELAKGLERAPCPEGLEPEACRGYAQAVRLEAARLRAQVGVFRDAALWRARSHRLATPTLTRAVGARADVFLPEAFFDPWRRPPSK